MSVSDPLFSSYRGFSLRSYHVPCGLLSRSEVQGDSTRGVRDITFPENSEEQRPEPEVHAVATDFRRVRIEGGSIDIDMTLGESRDPPLTLCCLPSSPSGRVPELVTGVAKSAEGQPAVMSFDAKRASEASRSLTSNSGRLQSAAMGAPLSM